MINEWQFFKMWFKVIFVAVFLDRFCRLSILAANSEQTLGNIEPITRNVKSQQITMIDCTDFDFVHVDFNEDFNLVDEVDGLSVRVMGSFDDKMFTSSPRPNAKRQKEEIVIRFPHNELIDPRLNTIKGQEKKDPIIIRLKISEIRNATTRSRFGYSYNTDDEESEESESIEDITRIPLVNNDKPLPIECKYGTPENPFPAFNIVKSGRRVSDIKCEEYTWYLKHRIIDVAYYNSECRKKQFVSGVIGGTTSKQGEFPHMAALGWLRNDNPKPVAFCGSSLISPRFSITAAHCSSVSDHFSSIYNLRSIKPEVAIVGSVDLNKGFRKLMEINIDSIIVLPEYAKSPHLLYNDIALVRLAEEVPISFHARPACLWSGALGEYTSGNITGWGQTTEGETNSLQTQLLYAKVDFINRNICQILTRHKINRNWEHGLIDNQFCAGVLPGGVNTCQGDSGGPIQVQKPVPNSNAAMYYVVGITSFGHRCAETSIPGIYTNVTSFLCWIEKTVWPEEANSACNGDDHTL